MLNLVALLSIVAMLMAYFLCNRTLRNQKPSVTNRHAYHRLALVPMTETNDPHMYENPSHYKKIGGKLRATSPQLVLMEKTMNAEFRDKIPWCLPPTYGNLEMHGAFPSVKTCRLEALCRTMVENIDVFRAEFNEHKAHFEMDSDCLAYNNYYGKIDINEGKYRFPRTRKVLETSADYTRTQPFNTYAGHRFMSTTFTVLYPGASIRPHFGPTNYRYRVHMCLDISGVGGIVTPYGTRFWKVGQLFILDDAYLHAGFYEGTCPRVIIMVDIAKAGLTYEYIDDMLYDVKADTPFN